MFKRGLWISSIASCPIPFSLVCIKYANTIKNWEAYVKVTDRTHLCSHILPKRHRNTDTTKGGADVGNDAVAADENSSGADIFTSTMFDKIKINIVQRMDLPPLLELEFF